MTCKRRYRADLALLIIRIGIGTIVLAHALLFLQAGVGNLTMLLGNTFQHIGILSLEFHVDKLSRPLL